MQCFLCLDEVKSGNFCKKHAEALRRMLDEKSNLVEKPEWEHHCRLCGAYAGCKIIKYKNYGPYGYEYYVYFCDKDILEEWKQHNRKICGD